MRWFTPGRKPKERKHFANVNERLAQFEITINLKPSDGLSLPADTNKVAVETSKEEMNNNSEEDGEPHNPPLRIYLPSIRIEHPGSLDGGTRGTIFAILVVVICFAGYAILSEGYRIGISRSVAPWIGFSLILLGLLIPLVRLSQGAWQTDARNAEAEHVPPGGKMSDATQFEYYRAQLRMLRKNSGTMRFIVLSGCTLFVGSAISLFIVHDAATKVGVTAVSGILGAVSVYVRSTTVPEQRDIRTTLENSQSHFRQRDDILAAAQVAETLEGPYKNRAKVKIIDQLLKQEGSSTSRVHQQKSLPKRHPSEAIENREPTTE